MVFEPMNVSLSLKLYSNTTDGLTVGYDICCTVRKESKAINTSKTKKERKNKREKETIVTILDWSYLVPCGSLECFEEKVKLLERSHSSM